MAREARQPRLSTAEEGDVVGLLSSWVSADTRDTLPSVSEISDFSAWRDRR